MIGHFDPTGTSVSGDGYGYSILKSPDRTHYAVRLAMTNHVAIIPVDDYDAAHTLGRRFCDCWHAWRTVQRRERALAQGFAVLGG